MITGPLFFTDPRDFATAQFYQGGRKEYPRRRGKHITLYITNALQAPYSIWVDIRYAPFKLMQILPTLFITVQM